MPHPLSTELLPPTSSNDGLQIVCMTNTAISSDDISAEFTYCNN